MKNKIGYLLCKWLLKNGWLRDDDVHMYRMSIDKYWLNKGFWQA